MSSKIFLILMLIVGCGTEEKPNPVDAPIISDNSVPPADATETSKLPEYPQTLYIATQGDLPTCDDSNYRQLIYVAETADFRACMTDGWLAVDVGKTIETKTVETTVEKLIPPTNFGNYQFDGPIAYANTSLLQMALSEMPNNQARLTVTVNGGHTGGPKVVVNQIVDIDRLEGITLVAFTDTYEIEFRDWHADGNIVLKMNTLINSVYTAGADVTLIRK